MSRLGRLPNAAAGRIMSNQAGEGNNNVPPPPIPSHTYSLGLGGNDVGGGWGSINASVAAD